MQIKRANGGDLSGNGGIIGNGQAQRASAIKRAAHIQPAQRGEDHIARAGQHGAARADPIGGDIKRRIGLHPPRHIQRPARVD